MRKLIESTLVSFDGVTGSPEQWGQITGDLYIERINAMPKYVASRALTHTGWNATLLGPDPSGAIARLKDQPGKDLIKYGTSRLKLTGETRLGNGSVILSYVPG